ncbi:hypothetical protein QBC35DRAFT_485320 [Podospora australis]|uniref:Uncharacterized protein n=1 Tax=Podospora australis TaxID=1536484 RepID=A0AAN6X5Z4_9PEZI|nr:hypothetical protein QBC35DRAFT_485320 [Podospora australis]
MALINPVHGLVVPFLCIFTLPLAIFAGITSALAFTVLMFRMGIVYFDIALALIPQYFRGNSTSKHHPALGPSSPFDNNKHHQRRHSAREGQKTPASPPGSAGSGSGYSTPSPVVAAFPQTGTGYLNSGYISPHRRKSSYGFGGSATLRRSRHSSSQVSLCSVGTITPIHEDEVSHDITPVDNTGLAAPSAGLDRDFEGIGGWRLDDRDNDSDWTNINSRLELPLERSSVVRHTQRPQSVGPVTTSEATYLCMRQSSKKESGGSPVEDREHGERGGWSFGSSPASAKATTTLPSPNTGRARLNQTVLMPPALTALDAENNYFINPDQLSPRSLRRDTP